jgi:hypothetical protein
MSPPRKKDDFLTFYGDPGETFGWTLGLDTKLLGGGQTPMWPLADDLWAKLNNPYEGGDLSDPGLLRSGVDPKLLLLPIKRIVLEDFRIYPWKLKALKFDPVRTARVIGAITFMCRLLDIELVFQPAAIKDAAQKAGAEELYIRPLHENRHHNDSVQHFVFYTGTEMLGRRIVVPNEGVQEAPA